MQFVDITTCLPATDLFIDIWSCNALGVYSSVSAAGKGGLGTIFPGHYSGRAYHEHTIAHSGATSNANGTYSGGHISHLSQLFFDQNLVTAVEVTSPYNTNRIAKASNNTDLFTGYSASASFDPFPEYIFVSGSSDLSKGLFARIKIGIRLSADYTAYGTNAACRDASGGHNNPNFNNAIVGNAPPVDTGPMGTPSGAITMPASTTTSSKTTSMSSAGTGTGTRAGTVAHWGQCGGVGWTGGTVCVSPYTCTYSNAWYSECL